MKIAKSYVAVNTSFPVLNSIRMKKYHIRVSSLNTVIMMGGSIVGCTCLRRTSDRTVDRLNIGASSFIVRQFNSSLMSDFVKYCICVDDKRHQFVGVLGIKWHINRLLNPYILTDKRLVISTCLVTLSIFFITGLHVIKQQTAPEPSEKLTEETGSSVASTQIQLKSGGGTRTYVFGADLSDDSDTEITEEELLNLRIKEDKTLADAEKNIILPGSESSANSSPDQSADSNSENGNHVTSAGESDSTEDRDSDTNNENRDSDNNSKTDEVKELPVTSLKETVLTQQNADVPDTDADPLFETALPLIGAISISDASPNYTITNREVYDVNVTFLLNGKTLASYNITKGSTKTVNLFESITETCRPTVIYTYFDETGNQMYRLRSEVMVYVYV